MTVVFILSVELWKMLVRRRGWGARWLSAPMAGAFVDNFGHVQAAPQVEGEEKV